jgi:hypothetical protein
VRFILLVLVSIGSCLGCRPSVSAADVYNELVAANCMTADDDGGVAAIAEEHGYHDRPWLECMFDGGTVVSCVVPCVQE